MNKNLSSPIKKALRWRWVSIVLLGVLANFFINWIFNFRSPIETFQFTEYLVALIVAFIILESIRWSNRVFSQRWEDRMSSMQSKLTMFSMDVVLVLFIVNGLGTAYMLLLYGSTYSIDEYFVINLITISFTAMFILPEIFLIKERTFPEDRLENKPIAVRFKNAQKWIPPNEIQFCYVNEGITYVVTTTGQYIADNNLNQLAELLSPLHFIRANRQYILSRSVIDQTRSTTYGKIEITLSVDSKYPSMIVVSRKQASAFRNWLKRG